MIMGFNKVWKQGPYKNKDTGFLEKIHAGIKKHSIRNGDRWVAGMKIHMATGVRTSDYSCFDIRIVQSVQKIRIQFAEQYRKDIPPMYIWIDGDMIDIVTADKLAKNDGFDSYADFQLWFYYATNKAAQVFKGQIIHWTNLKY